MGSWKNMGHKEKTVRQVRLLILCRKKKKKRLYNEANIILYVTRVTNLSRDSYHIPEASNNVQAALVKPVDALSKLHSDNHSFRSPSLLPPCPNPPEVFLAWRTMTIFTFQVWNKVSPGTYENELEILKPIKYSKFHTEGNSKQNW